MRKLKIPENNIIVLDPSYMGHGEFGTKIVLESQLLRLKFTVMIKTFYYIIEKIYNNTFIF